jgi:uncharacterized membrane protein
MVIRLKNKIDHARVRAAIERAERRSSGEIVVSIADFFCGDVARATRRTFERLGVANTRQRNGVLLFVAPARRRFEIRADEAIHAKVGQDFWEVVSLAVATRFRARDYTGGLVCAIDAIGDELANHFPRDLDDVNELPDEPESHRGLRGRMGAKREKA